MACAAGVAALAAMIGLSGCNETPRGGQPSFYRNLASPSAQVDTEAARATISAYRLNNGLPALVLDPGLQAVAIQEARAMAAADKPASADKLKARLAGSGVIGPEVNLSAGYRTLAEAFSGWRESPGHDRVMKAKGATRIGIATAYAPGSKYQVYWALVLGGPQK
ncbi:MAG: CAP domain-containing protein [Bosea sp. (in: a-proteobacteria)]